MADEYFSLKGFISYGALANNQPGVISPIGELSLRSGTFAKDRKNYVATTATSPSTSAELIVFSSRGADGDYVAPPSQVTGMTLQLATWAYEQMVNGTFTNSSDSFRVPLMAQFNDVVEDVSLGAMVTDGQNWLPASITFFIKPSAIFDNNPPEGMEGIRVRVWFSDENFRQQYDEFNVSFIGPLDNLDDLFLSPWVVAERLQRRTPPELGVLIQEAAGNSPYTTMRSFNFRYHSPTTLGETHPAYWTFVIWSDFGDNVDTLKRELSSWIIANSTHTREEWAVLFPDIFSSTEFILTPLWNQTAIPNLTLDHAMYSPTVTMSEAVTYVRATAAGTGYNDAHVDAHASFLSMPYKSVACLAVGGPENRNAQYKLHQVVPDYLAVPTSSIDFDRMSERTRFWCMRVFAMLSVAESMTEFSDIPPGLSRLKRVNANGDEILYVVATIDEIQYLVVAKQTLNTMFPPVDRVANPMVFTPDPTVTLTTPAGSKRLELNVDVSGGTPPYRFTASSADIETGGEIDPTTGFLDVTFREWGVNHIDVSVVDDRGFPATANYTIISSEEDDA